MFRTMKSKLGNGFRVDLSTVKFKFYYFMYYFGASSLPLYLPVFFRSVGMDAVKTGVLTAVRPYMRAVSGPLAGAIADKTGKHKLVLMVCLVVLATSFTSLCYIPILQGFERQSRSKNELNMTTTSRRSLRTSTSQRVLEPKVTLSNSSVDDPRILAKSTIFVSSLFQVIIGDFCVAPQDAIVSASIVNEAGSVSYGHQRLFGAIGFGLGSFLSGFAMDRTAGVRYIPGSIPPNGPNFLTAFIIFLTTNVFLIVLVGFKFEMIVHEKQRPPNLLRHVCGLLRNVGVILFIIFLFIIGLVGGVITFFLFWFLQDIGASQTLLGLSYAVMCVAEVAVFPFTGFLIDRLGHVGVLTLALVCLIARLIIYSVLQNPWYVLFVEPMHGITFAAMWAACISFASQMAPAELQTTMQGLISGVHFGLGWGTGAVLGGVVYGAYGPRNMFRGSAVLCGGGLVLLAIMWKTSTVGSRVGVSGHEAEVNVDEYEMISGESGETRPSRMYGAVSVTHL